MYSYFMVIYITLIHNITVLLFFDQINADIMSLIYFYQTKITKKVEKRRKLEIVAKRGLLDL